MRESMCVCVTLQLRNRFVDKNPVNCWGKPDILKGFTDHRALLIQ